MKRSVKTQLIEFFKAADAVELDVIQSLWSGYGTISRWELRGAEVSSVIVKHIALPEKSNHPRGWNTAISHQRKVRSYEVEMAWYKNLATKTNSNCRIPKCFFSEKEGEGQIMVLEDLDAIGFELRRSDLTVEEAKLCLKWLAYFHATFMQENPVGLWKEGTYWHLETRPDELTAMQEGWLKSNAKKLDQKLKHCQFQTLVHGDAKVANFCFSSDMKSVAAVDFQYVGGGCGMKDVVYFLGSCLTEQECELHQSELLEYYFETLQDALQNHEISIDYTAVEKEWRGMYAIAWADFTRFLLGWMPTHQKLNGYSIALVERAKKSL